MLWNKTGWQPYVEGESEYWNLWWKGSRYRVSEYANCRPWQRMNHFPKTAVVTRKDMLFRTLKTMRGIHGKVYDYFPQTFSLPNDYVKFVRVYAEEEERGEKSLYDVTSLENRFSHLTNTSINKFSPTLNVTKEGVGSGCKWDFKRLRRYFEMAGMNFEKIWERMTGIMILTLLPLVGEVKMKNEGCFELYGFGTTASTPPVIEAVDYREEVGDFKKVYPFNDATRRMEFGKAGNVTIKSVIQEVKKKYMTGK
ncbi:putative tubulin polyglutamylase ttll2 [Irineochytrium annulatum]|nr:putative tubulin polyglutamylase ttll2 [Irineochytrium annulatum]